MAVAAKGRHRGLQPRMLLLLLLVGPDLDPSENHSNHIYEFPTFRPSETVSVNTCAFPATYPGN
jgi:hypothetical protein